MKLKFINSYSEQTNESDYETAVDISHYSINDSKYIFETENGLNITLSYYSCSTTSSYLEPDFDEIDMDYKKGTPKKNYIYHSHASGEDAKYREELNIWVELPVEKKTLSVAEYEVYETYLKNPQLYNVNIATLHTKYTKKLVDKLYSYDNEWLEADRTPLTISNEEIKFIYTSLPNQLKPGQLVEIQLPQYVIDQLIHYDQKHLIILSKNEVNEAIQKANEEQAYKNLAHDKLKTELPLVTSILQVQPFESTTEQQNLSLHDEHKKLKTTSLFSKIKKIF